MHDSKSWVAPEITLDLLMEILARLPAKSVMRFKCISKVWSSLFRSSYFCNRFYMLTSSPGPRIYMSLMDRVDYSKSLLLSSAPSTCSPSSLVFDQDLTIPAMGGFYMRVVRGFISFTVSYKGRIYNPSTRQLVILPAVPSNIIAEEEIYNICYFVCHDPVNDQYKVLCTIAVISEPEDMQKVRSELWVYVLEAGGSWRRVAKDIQPHLPDALELTLNGVLYYLAWTDSHTCMLVSFDSRSEEFKMLQVPRRVGDVLPRVDKWMTQIEYGGKVTVFDFTHLKESGLWKTGRRKNGRARDWFYRLVRCI
ncbi:unnamed protein product [Thlaspi arvense]|uniref:F-box domain-containing protein n=1 Tax=Thlaspi arvense TaxID=13288 RepID=A0AAU9SFD5_THLAR|nr:unnamed protein product [Thlaspi arvense]